VIGKLTLQGFCKHWVPNFDIFLMGLVRFSYH